jgi:LPS O-antigen subunit length determinant protein (WzzB/FepE family)
MDRRMWLIGLAALGTAAIVLIALLNSGDDNSQAAAKSAFCSSVSTLESSVSDLTALDPSSASKDDYQSAVSNIESDWDAVKSAASDLGEATTSELQDGWDTFKSAVDDVPDDASVSDALNDVKAAAQTLASTAKTTLSGPDCS